MKTKKILFLAIVLLGMTVVSCKKETGCTDSSATNFKSSAEKDDGSCTYKGSVTFWNLTTSALGLVDVFVGGVPQGTITSDYASTPSCGDAGCVTFTAAPGTYSYSAAEQGTSKTWSGSITITSIGCTTVKLY